MKSVLFLKVQSTDINAFTHTKSTICHFKTSCNLNAHVNTVLQPLIRDAQPVTHEYVHECCLTIPVCVCLGENDPYYIDTISMPALLGVYQGAKPHIYHDAQDNQKPRVHDYDETDHHCIIQLP